MQVICRKGLARDLDIGDERYAASQSLLKRLDVRQIPVRLPECRLTLESNQMCVLDWPGRERRLPLISRRLPRALRQLLEFLAKYKVHLQRLRYFARNIKMVGSFRVQIYLLQEDQIRFAFLQKIEDSRQFEPALDVPVYDAKRIARPKLYLGNDKAARGNLVHRRFMRRSHIAILERRAHEQTQGRRGRQFQPMDDLPYLSSLP